MKIQTEFEYLLRKLYDSKNKSSAEITQILTKEHIYNQYCLSDHIEEIKVLMELSFNLKLNEDQLWRQEFYYDVFNNIDREIIFSELNQYVDILLKTHLTGVQNQIAFFYDSIFFGLKDIIPDFYSKNNIPKFNFYINMILDFFEFIKHINYTSLEQEAGFKINESTDEQLIDTAISQENFYLEKVDCYKDILYLITKNEEFKVTKAYICDEFVQGKLIYEELSHIIQGLKDIRL